MLLISSFCFLFGACKNSIFNKVLLINCYYARPHALGESTRNQTTAWNGLIGRAGASPPSRTIFTCVCVCVCVCVRVSFYLRASLVSSKLQFATLMYKNNSRDQHAPVAPHDACACAYIMSAACFREMRQHQRLFKECVYMHRRADCI